MGAQQAGYTCESGLFGTNQFPPDSIKIRRVDDHLERPLHPGEEARLVVEVDTTHAPIAEEWRRLEVRWFGCLTTWGEQTSNGTTTINVEHQPLFAYAENLWNNGVDLAVGGSSLIYEDHIISKKSRRDADYLRVSPTEQPAPSYSAAMSEKGAVEGSAGEGQKPRLQSFDIAIRLPEASQVKGGVLPASYRGDGHANLSRKVAQVIYCVQIIAKRKMIRKDRRVCAPIWVSPGDPFAPHRGQFSEKHAAYFVEDGSAAYTLVPRPDPFADQTLDARGVPTGWNRISLLDEHIKSWWFKKVVSVRTELFTPDAVGVPSGRWVPFVLLISAIYLDSSGKDSQQQSVEYQPQLVLRRREIRSHFGTSAEYRLVQLVYHDVDGQQQQHSESGAGAFYWQDDATQGSNTKHARLAGQFRIDVPCGFKHDYPALAVEYDLRIHWTTRRGNKFEKSLLHNARIRNLD